MVDCHYVVEYSDGRQYLMKPKDDADPEEAKSLRLIGAEVVMNLHKIK